MTVSTPVDATLLCGTAHARSVPTCPSNLPATTISFLRSRFRPDAEVIARLDQTAIEIRGTVPKLFPDDALPADVANTVRSLVAVLYSAKQLAWPVYPAPPLRVHPICQARETAQLLNAIGYRCSLRCANQQPPRPRRRWTVTESTRTLATGERFWSFGIALAGAGVDEPRWADVLCDVQIGSNAEDMPELLQRLHSGAACVFHHQETRIYHIGIAFAGDSFQVAHYDRAGCVLSGIYNVHEHPGTLVRTVMGLSYLDDSCLGKDTSVVSRDGREFTTVGGVEYEIVECLASDGDILGNGTTCWRCRRPDTDAQFVIKTKWTVVYPYRTSEAEFLKKAAGIDGVTTLVCEDKVWRANGFPQDTMWLRDVLQGPERLTILRDHPRMELRRLVLRPYGRPLEDFASIDELLAGFDDAIKAHHRLYERRILHCDISDNNVMLHDPDERDRSRGLLVDLDCAVFVRGADAVGPRGYGKGTHPFIACNVLNPDRYEARAPWHDLESFLYVLMYICTTCSGPHDTPRENFDIDDSPMGPWLAGDYEHKTRVMFEYGDAEFRAFLGGLFDPYFDDLKDLVVDLRRVITRTSPSQGNYYDVYDVLEEHMEARAAARESASEDMASEEGSPPEGYSTDNSLASPSTSNHCVGSLTRNTSAGSSVGSKRKHTSRDEHDGEDDSVTRARLLQSSSSRGTDNLRGSLPFSDVSSDTLPSSVYLPSSVDERTSLTSHSASQTFRVGDSALAPEEEKFNLSSHPTTEISQQPAVHSLKRRRVDCQLMVWL